MTQLSEVQARSILRKQKRVDSWFLSSYGMNLYRGCAHDCAYCLDDAARVVVMLEQIDHLVTLAGQRRSPYGRAARAVASLPGPLLLQVEQLQAQRDVGPALARLVREIFETGRCDLYEKVL
jgi:hypothetical protein